MVKTVLNFNVPKAVDDYIHRVGRTARAGRQGRAITLVGERDIDLIHAIETRVGIKLTLCEDVTEKVVLSSLSEITMARRAAALYLIEQDFDEKSARFKTSANKQKHAGAEEERSTKRKAQLSITSSDD